MYIETCAQHKHRSLYSARHTVLCAVGKGSLTLGKMSYLQETQLLLWFQLQRQRMKSFPCSGGNHDGKINASSVFLSSLHALKMDNGKQLMKDEYNPKWEAG